MSQLEPVIWSKGTFLNPQHLQIQDKFLENTIWFQQQALHFRPWGFRQLQIDQAALASGVFAVSQASGIMPDGLLFDMPLSDAVPPPRPLGPHFDPDQKTLEVHLAIPQYRDQGFNVAGGQRNEANTRFRADVEMVRDENTGQSAKEVMVARKNFRFLLEESLEGYSTLHIATVEKTPANLFQLQQHFVPPLLDFQASPYLTTIARRLTERLSSRSGALAGMRRQKNQTLADFTPADIPGFWLLYTINTALPTFRHLFSVRGGHPDELFGAMLSLAGALTAFSTKVHPRDFPSYDHDDLSTCFTILDEKLQLLLDTVVPSNFVSLPLKEMQPYLYATSLDRDDYLVNTRMYLAVKAEMSQADLILKTPQLIKVASADLVDQLVQKAVSGVHLTHVSPPNAIPIKTNYQYFSLAPEGLAWESIGKSRNVAAYVPADFPNAQLELIILLPKAT